MAFDADSAITPVPGRFDRPSNECSRFCANGSGMYVAIALDGGFLMAT